MQLLILEQSPTLTRVALDGRLDSAGVDAVGVKFTAAIVPPAKPTLVDLSAVSFLSSLGVRLLLSTARSLARAGAPLILVAPQPLVLDSIRHAALDQLIPIASDAAAAQAMLAK